LTGLLKTINLHLVATDYHVELLKVCRTRDPQGSASGLLFLLLFQMHITI